jgi:hypothetical protein
MRSINAHAIAAYEWDEFATIGRKLHDLMQNHYFDGEIC